MSSPEIWMTEALKLAQKGGAQVFPNPFVGALILDKTGNILSEGYHSYFGGPHAEIEALKALKEPTKAHTLVVNLEPCSHQGKTAPCTEAILKSSIKQLIYGTRDPYDKVNGQGIKVLQEAGIEVVGPFLEKECRILNRAFFCFHEKKRPWVTLKVALSLNSKMARDREAPLLLSSNSSQVKVHELRAGHQAILVGAGTVLSDNPHLGVRHTTGRDPLRVILKGERELDSHLQIFRDENVLILDHASVSSALEALYERQTISVLVEGGQQVIQSFLESGQVDELILIYSPRLLPESSVSFYDLEKDLSLKILSSELVGGDVWIRATLL